MGSFVSCSNKQQLSQDIVSSIKTANDAVKQINMIVDLLVNIDKYDSRSKKEIKVLAKQVQNNNL